jgi:hypothetical protein
LLVKSRCVDPPGTYGLDGCAAQQDPWRSGHAPFLFSFATIFIFAALGLLRASRFACGLLLLTIFLYFASSFYAEVSGLSRAINLETGEPYGVEYALSAYWNYLVEKWWLWPLWWLIFDAWFLFGSRAKNVFLRPPNTSLERTRGG